MWNCCHLPPPKSCTHLSPFPVGYSLSVQHTNCWIRDRTREKDQEYLTMIDEYLSVNKQHWETAESMFLPWTLRWEEKSLIKCQQNFALQHDDISEMGTIRVRVFVWVEESPSHWHSNISLLYSYMCSKWQRCTLLQLGLDTWKCVLNRNMFV